MLKLNLGCGRTRLPGWIGVDRVQLDSVDVVFDLNDCRRTRLDFRDNSVDEMLLSHTLEHIPDTLGLMEELHRIAKPDSLLTVRLPYGSSDDAWEDPTHVRAYFLRSWMYFGQPYYWRADYGYRGDWQVRQVKLLVKREVYSLPPDEAMRRIDSERNIVEEMVAELLAVKPIRPPLKERQEQLNLRICLAT